MMDVEKKVQILRACSSKKGNRCSSCPAFGKGDRNCLRNTMRDAATALSAQQAENEKLRAELVQAKRERDAAVNAIRTWRFCESCKFGGTPMNYDCLGCYRASKWVWNGQKEG